MNFFEQNRRHLVQLFPKLSTEVFARFHPSESLSIGVSAQHAATAQLEGRWIHSKHNPCREAARLLDNNSEPLTPACIFFGFGLGYQIEEFFRRFPQGEAIIVEQSPELFLKALTARDYTSLFNEKTSLLIGLGVTDLRAALSPLISRNHAVIPLLPITQTAPDYYSLAHSIVEAERSRKRVNSTTVKRFGRRWIRNLAQNLDTMAMAGNLNQLRDLLRGIPALVIAAGPTLDAVLPDLKQLQQRMVLIATDTSLRALLRNGVTPDFTLVVDPQYWNTRHLDGLDLQATILISESATHSRVFQNSYRAVFFSGSVFPLGGYLEPGDEAAHKLGAGGSVTTTAWDFARYIGADEIYLSGLDLGFPEKRTHYCGSFFEQLLFTHSYRFRPYEGLIFNYLHSGDPFYHENYGGGLTLTDRRLIIYRQWFEEQIAKDSGSTFTLSPKGVKIPGIQLATISQLLKLPPSRPVIDRQIDRALQLYTAQQQRDQKKRAEQLQGRINSLIEELHSLKSIAQQGLRVIAGVEGYSDDQLSRSKIQETLYTLDTLDQKLLLSASRHVVGFLINPVLEQIQDELSSSQNLQENLQSSQRVYQHLLDSAKFHIEVFSNSK
ncbi:MAG: 6-hydroxymethylpterin diphosphokinase MptE-like protein [Spirochaetia bacterium]|nr:6-hydroxymethylpterin diphosphokinase MptE-like protein [Spirochaetia bacterium]